MPPAFAKATARQVLFIEGFAALDQESARG